MSISKPLNLRDFCSKVDLTNAGLCGICFEDTGIDDRWKCWICTIERRKVSGWTNLISHLESKHLQTLTEDVKKLTGDRKGPTNSHLRNLSQDAKDYHDWIEWLVMSDLPFTFVESRYTRKNSRVNAISRPTLMQYMNEVTYLYLIKVFL